MPYKLVCFDLDGCLTEKDDSWSYIHHHLGVWDEAKKHRKLFFEGRISYQEWADLDVGLWKGTSIEELKGIIKQIRVRPNIEQVVKKLKERNLVLIIISSGLSLFADRLKEEFYFDYATANSPLIGIDGRLTGACEVSVKYDNKHEVLDLILKDKLPSHAIKMDECIAVGDGENDIPLFKAVGFSIAFNPLNDEIANSANVAVKNGGLLEVLSLILSQL